MKVVFSSNLIPEQKGRMVNAVESLFFKVRVRSRSFSTVYKRLRSSLATWPNSLIQAQSVM
jgi:hypothetical protein